MKRLFNWASLCLLFFFTAAHAQQAVKPASEVLKEACQQAGKEKKNVIIIFHASWCHWCHEMDARMNQKELRPLFDKSYVVRHLVVQEADNKKHLENPGAEEMMKKFNGDRQGIPYWLVFDKKGKLLADSQERPEGASLSEKGNNIGCPGTPKEIVQFTKILKQTSTLNDTELALIGRLFANKE